jgi:hypothetical protein
MKTQTIELDDATATALRQRAEERGVSVPELLAELLVLEAGPTRAGDDEIAELDRRWNAFEAQVSVISNDDVVRWVAQDLGNRGRNIGKSSSRFSAPTTYFSSTSMESGQLSDAAGLSCAWSSRATSDWLDHRRAQNKRAGVAAGSVILSANPPREISGPLPEPPPPA